VFGNLMSPASEQDKLNEQAARINEAQAPRTLGPAKQESMGMGRAGYDLLAAILGGTLAGWLIDHFMPAVSPWGLIGMMLIGFVVGIMNVWRAMSADAGSPADKDKPQG